MSEGIWTMPFAHFTCSTAATAGKRSVCTIFTYQHPVWCRVLRTTADEPIETCIVNTSNTIVVPINNPTGGDQVAGINIVPGSQEASPSGVVLYEAREGYRTDAAMGLLGTDGFLETASSTGVMLSLPDKTIIPPYCTLAVAGVSTNRALALACVGYEIRFGYEVDDNGVPVPRRTRR